MKFNKKILTLSLLFFSLTLASCKCDCKCQIEENNNNQEIIDEYFPYLVKLREWKYIALENPNNISNYGKILKTSEISLVGKFLFDLEFKITDNPITPIELREYQIPTYITFKFFNRPSGDFERIYIYKNEYVTLVNRFFDYKFYNYESNVKDFDIPKLYRYLLKNGKSVGEIFEGMPIYTDQELLLW